MKLDSAKPSIEQPSRKHIAKGGDVSVFLKSALWAGPVHHDPHDQHHRHHHSVGPHSPGPADLLAIVMRLLACWSANYRDETAGLLVALFDILLPISCLPCWLVSILDSVHTVHCLQGIPCCLSLGKQSPPSLHVNSKKQSCVTPIKLCLPEQVWKLTMNKFDSILFYSYSIL